jgi:uncharacterized membrane protein
MVVTTYNQHNTLITLSPNRSATWQQTKWVIAVMSAVIIIIATAWTFVGAWVVLPFAGLELGLFAYLMYRVSRFTYNEQTINIDSEYVTVKFGYRIKKTQATFERKLVDIYYSESDNNWELPKIALCSKHQKLLVGEFLNLEDRVLLRDDLQKAGFVICRNQWWKS